MSYLQGILIWIPLGFTINHKGNIHEDPDAQQSFFWNLTAPDCSVNPRQERLADQF